MARGWESKSIELQKNEAQDVVAPVKGAVSENKKIARRELANLTLARTNVLRQIESSSSDTYKQSLQRALAALDQKIEELQRDE